jgi:hypothetical protein
MSGNPTNQACSITSGLLVIRQLSSCEDDRPRRLATRIRAALSEKANLSV